NCQTIFSAGPHRRAVANQDGFEVKVWTVGLNPKLSRAALSANRFDINVPIAVGAKHDSPALLGINNANVLLVQLHDRMDMTSSLSSRGTCLRSPDRIFGTEKAQLDRISRLNKRFRRWGTSVMSRQ